MNDKIAIYLRLSLADGDLKKGSKDESNSIENQRMLLHDYIGKQEDLFGEIVDAAFGRKFWDYVKQAGYEHRNKSSGMPQFYRFSHPTSNRYPAMIELFTRKLDAIQLPDDAVLTPLPMDEEK